MASEIGDVAVRVGADITDLKRGMAEASESVGSFGSKARQKLNSTVGSLAAVGAAAVAAAAAITVHLVNGAREAIDAQAKMAQQLDTTSASMATLKRAGELSGVEMKAITTASRTLAVRMGDAQQGVKLAKDAFDALGISAQDLAKVPLDQRISMINNALVTNVDVSQRASVASRLFGARAATAMKMLDDGTLEKARHETELFGLALSDVDAAKVEQANDAMSTIHNAVDGVVQQFTVQLAPILKAVADQFIKTAEEAGGFGNVAKRALDSVVDGIAFAMNAVDGLKRVFQVVADGVIASWSGMIALITKGFANVLEMFDSAASKVGIDLFKGPAESVRRFSDEAAGVAKEAFSHINDTLMEPLAGDKFKTFVESARQAGQAAAEAAVQARDAVGGNVVQMDSGRSPQEIQKINKRLEAIRTANKTELQILQDKYIAENDVIKQGLDARQITQEQAYALSNGAAQRYADGRLKIEQSAASKELQIERQKEQAKRAILGQAFGGLSALMNSESRKMFEIGKAASISQAIVSTYTGMAKALELGWPLGPIAAGAIALNGFAQVANIRKQSFGGGGAAAPTGSTTGQINAANTPVSGGAVGGQQESSRNMYVHGIDINSVLTGGQVIEMINKAADEGYQLRIAPQQVAA